ncbi:MCE family protein [Nocardia donostiensis]|uniref:Mammalian cell entry protein n=1 Tax=Nocardia donostiensis TaxID=1538463 RepID=A0A1V2TCS4_9NOCA|nr:MCE family protein [Nocardia donostiensis]ONM47131.1 mammalian cell entry protein [Nocardia donostiensis]OQS15198.1 mammalian cell entry protein [Nocardia donostiensis]OQS20116.1 mammalian cell entry protein [Nocardia donostiensis]
MSRLRRVSTFARAGAAVCAGLLLTSCADGIYSIPLPGGADLGDHPMHIDIQFDDVLDLVPQSAVTVDGVPVGRVEEISLGADGWTATVSTLVNASVELPADARAEVRQSNLLGEKFIELSAPENGTVGRGGPRLSDGAVIPLGRTRHATEVEQVLGALSLLLNGGGVAQLQPIVAELSTALDGREGRVRALLENAESVITGLNEQVADITRTLDGLETLSNRVAAQTGQLEQILDELPEGIRILEEQRPQLITLLEQLDRLGRVGFDVINTAKDDLITDLRALRPTLQELGRAAPDLVTALPLIPTYPFPDSTLAGTFGGQVNTFLSVDLQIGVALSNLGVGKPDPVYIPPVGPPVNVNPTNPYYNGNGPRPGWPTVSLSLLPPLPPGLVALPEPGQTADARPRAAQILEQMGIGGGPR